MIPRPHALGLALLLAAGAPLRGAAPPTPRPAPTRGGEHLLRLVDDARPGFRKSASDPDSRGAHPPIQIRIGPESGWERSWIVSNGEVEAVVVPAVGRIMQFRRVGHDGPFWDDPALHGKLPDPASNEWGNFGGDKTWPAPQSEWGRRTRRDWPPPPTFDAVPLEASVRRDTVVLVSPVDPDYGIRTERVLEIPRPGTAMTVTTTYEKVSGEPVEVGVWIITQLRDPVAVFAPVPRPSRFPEGYVRQSGDVLPAGLSLDRGLLSMTRDRKRSTKIGSDADRLLWVGEREMLLIESPRQAGAEYPDQGSSAEVYTNPDPKTYVELELLGPLRRLKVGDRLSQTNTYTLLPRTEADPAADARKALKLRDR